MHNIHTSNALFMVEPTTFGFDEETSISNVFQHHPKQKPDAIKQAALAEFNAFVASLRQHDIQVITFHDKSSEQKPDAVFPNNWVSTWPDGRVFLYPMATPSRRIERSIAALESMGKAFVVKEVLDISSPEHDGQYLESTGAMVFDHANKIVYACLSVRCDEELLRAHSAALGYQVVAFHATTKDGTPIYHTNVMMAVQSKTAVVCTESIVDPTEREHVLATLHQTGHEVVTISLQQMLQFCGNVLEVQNHQNELFLVLSQSAYDSFTAEQRHLLGKNSTLLPMSIPTIETIGGGSARCMVAEIFLQPQPIRWHAVPKDSDSLARSQG